MFKHIKRMGRTALSAAAVLLAALPAAAAPSFESTPLYLRAFSPNGDGSQDSCRIRFAVRGEEGAPDRIELALYADPELPPGSLPLAAPAPDSLRTSGLRTEAFYTWHGRAGDDGPGQPLLPDGFYYLHIAVSEGNSTLWLDPPVQLELNTAGPSLAALALEPADYFTPLQSGADTLLQFFFYSTDFDTLTDEAWATVSRQGTAGDYEQVAQIERDPHYFRLEGSLGRFRLLWSGEDGEALIEDGNYRLDLRVEDDAGNPGDGGRADCNLDAKAPTIAVVDFGGPVSSGSNFTVRPEALPDSFVVKVTDRNGIVACRSTLDAASGAVQVGRLLASSSPGEHFYAFDLPPAWGAPDDPITTHHYFVDASDATGNWRGDLSSPLNLGITLDGTAPPVPTWDAIPGSYIQPVAILSGLCDELAVSIELAEDGLLVGTAVTDIEGRFSLPVALSEGRHTWTATAVDGAGNRSAPSAGLELLYTPGPALRIPGRLREAGEQLLINTTAPARAVILRVYSLDGELLRRLDAEGGPEQFSVAWDLADAGGRALMDGLCVLNIETVYLDGTREQERKVVAIVRAAP